MAVASVVGVVSGVYIFGIPLKEYSEELQRKQQQQQQQQQPQQQQQQQQNSTAISSAERVVAQETLQDAADTSYSSKSPSNT